MDAAAPAPSSAFSSKLSLDETLRASARFGLIIELLCRAVAARGAKGGFAWLFRGASAGPLVVRLWTRLRRAAARFTALAEQNQGPQNQAPRRTPIRKSLPTPPRMMAGLPRRFAWLLRPVPEAAASAAQLRYFLNEPDIQNLIAADPRFGRILRPLCHMIGIRPPPFLRLVRPGPSPASATVPPPVPAVIFYPPPPAAPAAFAQVSPPDEQPNEQRAPPLLPFQQRFALPEPLATPPAFA